PTLERSPCAYEHTGLSHLLCGLWPSLLRVVETTPAPRTPQRTRTRILKPEARTRGRPRRARLRAPAPARRRGRLPATARRSVRPPRPTTAPAPQAPRESVPPPRTSATASAST